MNGAFIKERNISSNGFDRLRSISNLVKDWDQNYWIELHAKYWSLCIPTAILYVIAVHWGSQMMKNRKAYNLRFLLGIWSSLLGVFSILGAYYLLPEIISTLYNDGFHKAACENSYSSNKEYLFWGWLFTWSKLIEFGDTAFILLRKQKLGFLHWYHHAMTLICVFSYFPGHYSINRWTGSMNFFVHSIMYTYYAFKAFNVSIPKYIAFTITISQISQMMIGFYVASYIFVQAQSNVPCTMTKTMAAFSFTIYLSYFILFLNFFIRTYFMKKPVSNMTKPEIEKKIEASSLLLDENCNIRKQKVN